MLSCCSRKKKPVAPPVPPHVDSPVDPASASPFVPRGDSFIGKRPSTAPVGTLSAGLEKPVPSSVVQQETWRSRWVLNPGLRVMKWYFGYHVFGDHLERIKPGRSLVLMHHSLLTLEVGLFAQAYYERYGQRPHILVQKQLAECPGVGGIVKELGCEVATRDCVERLLQESDVPLILLPGGREEALRPSSRKNEVWWDAMDAPVRSHKTAVKWAHKHGVLVHVVGGNADDAYDVHCAFPKISAVTKMPTAVASGRWKTLWLFVGIPKNDRPLFHRVSKPIDPKRFEDGEVFFQRVYRNMRDTMARVDVRDKVDADRLLAERKPKHLRDEQIRTALWEYMRTDAAQRLIAEAKPGARKKPTGWCSPCASRPSASEEERARRELMRLETAEQTLLEAALASIRENHRTLAIKTEDHAKIKTYLLTDRLPEGRPVSRA
jgi:hypothetical protein